MFIWEVSPTALAVCFTGTEIRRLKVVPRGPQSCNLSLLVFNYRQAKNWDTCVASGLLNTLIGLEHRGSTFDQAKGEYGSKLVWTKNKDNSKNLPTTVLGNLWMCHKPLQSFQTRTRWECVYWDGCAPCLQVWSPSAPCTPCLTLKLVVWQGEVLFQSGSISNQRYWIKTTGVRVWGGKAQSLRIPPSVINRASRIGMASVESPGGYAWRQINMIIYTSFPHWDQEVESLPIWCQSINVSDTL